MIPPITKEHIGEGALMEKTVFDMFEIVETYIIKNLNKNVVNQCYRRDGCIRGGLGFELT